MNRRRRGLSLINLLVVLLLMAVFAAVAQPLLTWSIRTMTTPPPTAAAAELDAAVGALRRDVWRSTALATPSPHELTLTVQDGPTVTWRVGPGGRLERDDHHWPTGLYPDATVAIDGSAVRLTLPDARGFHGGTVTLPSQAMLIGRDTP